MSADGMSVTSADRGPLLNIINWILLVVMCLATIIKVFTKWIMVRNLQHDDAYMVAGMVFAVGFSIAVSAQVSAGLGQHMSSLSQEQVVRYQKAVYASQLMYAVSVFLAKMALFQILVTLSRNNTRRSIVYGVMVFNVVSMVIMILAIAFQCRLPNSWEVLSPRCFSQSAFWNAFGAIDILIDLAAVLLPTYLLYDLHISRQKKVPVILAFSSRVLIIPIIIVRLVFFNDALSSSDRAFDDFHTVLLTSVHTNLNVIVTCIPFLKPVMDGIQSGILASDVRSLAPITSSGYIFNTAKKRSDKPVDLALTTRVTAGSSESRQSRGDSEERMIIKQTREFGIHYESL